VVVSFSYANATLCQINFGDGSGTHTFQLSGSPGSFTSEAYQDPGTIAIVVVVSGPGGSATDTTTVNVQ
jgi:hypothetical protein